jgi:hypothetical protein
MGSLVKWCYPSFRRAKRSVSSAADPRIRSEGLPLMTTEREAVRGALQKKTRRILPERPWLIGAARAS